MPNILSHASFSYLLGTELSCFSDDHTMAIYLIGSYGPDIYFFDRLPPTPFQKEQKPHANLLHAAPCDELACSFLDHAEPNLFPFVYGFLTHIALDSTLHPYVCSRYSGPDHTRFESDIDSVMYDRYHYTVPFERAVCVPPEVDEMDRLITDVSIHVVHKGVLGAYKRSLNKLARLYPFMYDPFAKKLHSVSSVERVFKKEKLLSGFLLGPGHHYFPDAMNESHSEWTPLLFPDEKRTESVDELFTCARTLAKNLILSAKEHDLDSIRSLLRNRTMKDGPLPVSES